METELDILQMPLDGLAAYWLSLKKLVEAKKGAKVLEEEADHTSEPYIASYWTQCSRTWTKAGAPAGGIRRESSSTTGGAKIELMSLALYAVASVKNRADLLRMDSRFHDRPMVERRAFELAGGVFAAIKDNSSDLPTLRT
jgi:hypothetical protein